MKPIEQLSHILPSVSDVVDRNEPAQLGDPTLCSQFGEAFARLAAVDEFARDAVADDMRDGDAFQDATAAPRGATRLEHLIAFSGRAL
jgi:hypothetical protein